MPQLVLPLEGAEQQRGVGFCVQRFKLSIPARHHRPRRAWRHSEIRDSGTKGARGVVILLHTLTLGPSIATAKARMSYDITQPDAQK